MDQSEIDRMLMVAERQADEMMRQLMRQYFGEIDVEITDEQLDGLLAELSEEEDANSYI